MSISRIMQMARAGVPDAGGWDISLASYVQGFSIASQDADPRALFLKPDGTKMYICGNANDSIFEYDLSSAWDISSSSFSQSFSVSAQDIVPRGLFLKPDGLKMYVAGAANNSIFEYNLSSAWDVSTASYSQSFDISAQDTAVTGLLFKPDGLKMYVTGSANDSIYEYDLSSAWDVSTASYLQSFSLASQDTVPAGTFLKPDGTKMYVTGTVNDSIFEYDLSSAWDVSTASFLQSLSVVSQVPDPRGLSLGNNGTKMYIACRGNDAVYEYDL